MWQVIVWHRAVVRTGSVDWSPGGGRHGKLLGVN